MISGIMRRAAMAGALLAAATVLFSGPAASASAAPGATPGWAHRTLAVETLSHFQVVITAIDDGGNPPRATVVATGFRNVHGVWRVISTQVIGKRGEWSWFAVDVCSLTATQFVGSKPLFRVARISIKLLATPSIGCVGPFFRSWHP